MRMSKTGAKTCVICVVALQVITVGCLLISALMLRHFARSVLSDRLIQISISLIGMAIGLVIALSLFRWSEAYEQKERTNR